MIASVYCLVSFTARAKVNAPAPDRDKSAHMVTNKYRVINHLSCCKGLSEASTLR